MKKQVKKVKEIEQITEEGLRPVNHYKEYKLENCKIGDVIYLEQDSTEAYEILDLGVPFCLILEYSTNFCHLYKGSRVYKRY